MLDAGTPSLRPRRKSKSAVRIPLRPCLFKVLSCCLLGLLRCLASAQAQEDAEGGAAPTGGTGGGGVLVRSGIIGNYMDREDYEFCLEAMRASDEDGDGEISEEEFVDFCRYMAPPFSLDGFDSFEVLPVAFRDVFFGVACLCDPSGAAGSECCAGDGASIRVPDVASVDGLTSEDRLYLYAACSNTKSVANNYADHANQTTPQSTPLWPVQPPPTVSEPPSAQPPSADSTERPTGRPTRRPANDEEKTPSPSPSPSQSPTEEPAVEVEPTSGPTGAGTPTTQPSSSNSSSPAPSSSPLPTAGPGLGEPTSQPSPAPTPLDDLVAEATAKVEYFFSVPTSVLGNGTGTAPDTDANATSAGSGGGTSEAMVSILSDLQVAMNRLAPQVTIHSDRDVRWEPHYRRRRRRRNRQVRRNVRRLQALQVLLPTSFGNLAQVDCPPDLADAAAAPLTCNWIVAVIPLKVVSANATSDETNALVQDYEDRLSEAVAAGRLQDELLEVNPSTPVAVFATESGGGGGGGAGPSPTASPGGTSDKSAASGGLSAGAISGIAIAAAVLMIPIVVFVFRSRRREKSEQQKKPTTMYTEEEEVGPSYLPDADTNMDDDAEQPSSPPPTAYESRAIPPAPIPTPLPSYNDDDEADDVDVPESETTLLKYNPDDASLEEAASNVSAPQQARSFESSGDDAVAGGSYGARAWSGSTEEGSSSAAAVATGMTAAAVVATAGAAGVVVAARRRSRSRSRSQTRNDEEKQPLLTDEETGSQLMVSDDEEMVEASAMTSAIAPSPQEQLESHIEAGDWAAVGATAALLAAASDSASGTTSASNSRAGRSKSWEESADNSGADARRAAELDRLVDKGDWDGLVAAASKYETSSNAEDENPNISTVSSPRTGSSVSSGSVASGSDTGTGTIGSPSYESTVSDSQGRSQRRSELRAEVEALVRRVVPDEIDNVDEMMEQFKGREEELVETLRNMQERSVAQKARVAKQKAAKVEARRSVQRGVVPGARDVLGRAGDSESERADDDSPSDTGATAASALGSEGLNDSLDQNRTALEAAIDAGDWQAVGEAAALLSDNSVISADAGDLNLSGYSEGSGARIRSLGSIDARRAEELDALVERRDWRAVMDAAKRYSEDGELKETKGRPSKEEEEALKQAELWRTFAEQMKPGATDEGASNAAEWAIQRSLSQLNESEKKKSSGGGTYEV